MTPLRSFGVPRLLGQHDGGVVGGRIPEGIRECIDGSMLAALLFSRPSKAISFVSAGGSAASMHGGHFLVSEPPSMAVVMLLPTL